MTLQQAIDVLETYNKWRKGAEIPQEKPHIIGMAIDIIVGYHKDEPITKQALLDRGFKENFNISFALKLSTEKIVHVLLFRKQPTAVTIIIKTVTTPVNCRTLKQLDSLIELFKEK